MKAKKSVKYTHSVEGSSPRVNEGGIAAPEIGAFAAKTHLSEILNQVTQGKSFFITKHGKRIAELRPAVAAPAKRIAGLWRDKMWIAPDFDAPLDDFKEYME